MGNKASRLKQRKHPDEQDYAPPPGRPPLKRVQVAGLRSLDDLASQGWCPLDLESPHPAVARLAEAVKDLFPASESFFELPLDVKRLAENDPRDHGRSEIGFSSILGEKELITLKSVARTPECLRPAGSEAWAAAGAYLRLVLDGMAESMGLDPKVWDGWTEDATTLQPEKVTPTLFRLFRYDGKEQPEQPDSEGSQVVVVSDVHRDIGLLSLVLGRSPGLEVPHPSGGWIPLELPKEQAYGLGRPVKEGEITATVLVGTTAAFLTQGLYAPGPHRVVMYPGSGEGSKYRFSGVLALRPSTTTISLSALESIFTPRFSIADRERYDGQSSDRLFGDICGKRFNVNAGKEVRELQRKKMEEMARARAEQDHEGSQTGVGDVPGANPGGGAKEELGTG